MSQHIVDVRKLSYSYPDGTVALKEVSFGIRHGESVALVGGNGAGKTTLLLHLNGYLTAREGSVRIGDDVVRRETLASVRRAVGMVFQDPDDQLFMPTVGADVAFGPLNLGLPPAQVERIVAEVLTTAGALHLRHRPPYRLSAGEKRSAAVAAVLALSPDILAMDEPSASLDPEARRRLIAMLAGSAHTKIIATHDLDMAMDLCSRVIVLRDGSVVADGPAERIFQDDVLLEACRLERPLRLQGCPVCGAVDGRTDQGASTTGSGAVAP